MWSKTTWFELNMALTITNQNKNREGLYGNNRQPILDPSNVHEDIHAKGLNQILLFWLSGEIYDHIHAQKIGKKVCKFLEL